MGSAQSSPPRGEEDEENGRMSKRSKEKVLEQEPEILPYHTSATPLTPQLSAASTPRLLGPSIKVWDPCNVLLQPPPPLSFPRSFDSDDSTATEVFLINHGESEASLRPDLVGGRCPAAKLTAAGERQARALAVFLNSQGVRFNAVYASPLDRAMATAASVCRIFFEHYLEFRATARMVQSLVLKENSAHTNEILDELNFPEERIQSTDALLEMNQGQWEGCVLPEIYTPEMVSLIDRHQPDFSAPSGESIRQVEFRMIEFLNRTVERLPEKLSTDLLMHRNESRAFSHHSSANSVQVQDGPHWDLPYRFDRQGLTRKRSGKSRLQIVTTMDNEIEDEVSPREANHGNILHEANTKRHSTNLNGVFTHATPIKCLLTSILNCSPATSHKICIDDSSVTVLQHSLRAGWCIKRVNDTSHLRLL